MRPIPITIVFWGDKVWSLMSPTTRCYSTSAVENVSEGHRSDRLPARVRWFQGSVVCSVADWLRLTNHVLLTPL